jgi:hypothetical protein
VSIDCLPLQTAWPRLSRHLQEIETDTDGNGIWRVTDYPAAAFVIKSRQHEVGERLYRKLYNSLPEPADGFEPMMNVIMWRSGDFIMSVVLPRRKHRPDCYTAKGDAQYIISPGAVDMGGLIITPR